MLYTHTHCKYPPSPVLVCFQSFPICVSAGGGGSCVLGFLSQSPGFLLVVFIKPKSCERLTVSLSLLAENGEE